MFRSPIKNQNQQIKRQSKNVLVSEGPEVQRSESGSGSGVRRYGGPDVQFQVQGGTVVRTRWYRSGFRWSSCLVVGWRSTQMREEKKNKDSKRGVGDVWDKEGKTKRYGIKRAKRYIPHILKEINKKDKYHNKK